MADLPKPAPFRAPVHLVSVLIKFFRKHLIWALARWWRYQRNYPAPHVQDCCPTCHQPFLAEHPRGILDTTVHCLIAAPFALAIRIWCRCAVACWEAKVQIYGETGICIGRKPETLSPDEYRAWRQVAGLYQDQVINRRWRADASRFGAFSQSWLTLWRVTLSDNGGIAYYGATDLAHVPAISSHDGMAEKLGRVKVVLPPRTRQEQAEVSHG